jgi:hypothetical protein
MSIVYFFNFPCNIHLNEGTEEEARYDRRCKLVPRQHELVPVEGGGGVDGVRCRESKRDGRQQEEGHTQNELFFS